MHRHSVGADITNIVRLMNHEGIVSGLSHERWQISDSKVLRIHAAGTLNEAIVALFLFIVSQVVNHVFDHPLRFECIDAARLDVDFYKFVNKENFGSCCTWGGNRGSIGELVLADNFRIGRVRDLESMTFKTMFHEIRKVGLDYANFIVAVRMLLEIVAIREEAWCAQHIGHLFYKACLDERVDLAGIS